MGKRHKSRISALQILYSLDIREELESFTDEKFAEISENRNSEISHFAETLVKGVCKNLKEIDLLISESSDNWKVNRMSAIDRNILRLGTFELLECEPPPMIINEAIILAETHGAEGSIAFINGILDNLKIKIYENSRGNK